VLFVVAVVRQIRLERFATRSAKFSRTLEYFHAAEHAFVVAPAARLTTLIERTQGAYTRRLLATLHETFREIVDVFIFNLLTLGKGNHLPSRRIGLKEMRPVADDD
jgi:hypothetical protein